MVQSDRTVAQCLSQKKLRFETAPLPISAHGELPYTLFTKAARCFSIIFLSDLPRNNNSNSSLPITIRPTNPRKTPRYLPDFAVAPCVLLNSIPVSRSRTIYSEFFTFGIRATCWYRNTFRLAGRIRPPHPKARVYQNAAKRSSRCR